MVAVTARRALADRHGHRLLRRDRRLPARSTSAARPGVDGGARGWCEQQPDMVAFTGLPGAPRRDHAAAAARGARRSRRRGEAGRRCRGGTNPAAAGEAHYQQGEVHRLRGEFAPAEEAYRDGEPARARAAAGPGAAAAGAGRTEAAAARDPPRAARPPSRSSARGCCPRSSRSCSPSATRTRRARACDELEEIAARLRERSAGRDGGARAGRRRARRGRRRRRPAVAAAAFAVWQRVGAPYIARTRAC